MTLSTVYKINTPGEHTVQMKTALSFWSPETVEPEYEQEVESNVLKFTVSEGSSETPGEEKDKQKDLCEKPTSHSDQSIEANAKASEGNPQERQPLEPNQSKGANDKPRDHEAKDGNPPNNSNT